MMVKLLFEPRDLWVGVFWDRRADGLYVYVCLAPMLVLRITFEIREPDVPQETTDPAAKPGKACTYCGGAGCRACQ